ncbi:hypothetical protein CYMTET_48942 [Cymbomonas tetramitiformis]|uniref:TOG domain-containing protein n=1 Tax=Cymbomonas tetramitiformis TaxID=36881 RepID=A0AAE0BT49_9CHLO|nr:hypothetical protein CYMTET_48942 [Cymbomonas tetramitiformis]
MEALIQELRSKDTKTKLSAVQHVQDTLERQELSRDDLANLIEALLPLFKDNSAKVSQGALQGLILATQRAGEYFKPHVNSVLSALVERLGDSKAAVRDAGRELLLSIMEVATPGAVVEKVAGAWVHKNWRVREEIARAAAEAMAVFGMASFNLHKDLLPQASKLLEDSQGSVRESAVFCLEEIYRQLGPAILDHLQKHSIRPAKLKELSSRFSSIQANVDAADSPSHRAASPPKPAQVNTKPSMALARTPASAGARPQSGKPRSPPATSSGRPSMLDAGTVAKARNVKPIRVHSEREMEREFQAIAKGLQPENDWQARIALLERIEGMVLGAGGEYDSLPSLLRTLRDAIIAQLVDRRSAVVKQACQLLIFLASYVGHDIDSLVEFSLPTLFKILPITVQIMTESADVCIHGLIHYLHNSRFVPKLTDAGIKDRDKKIRACCQEYLRRVLVEWGSADCWCCAFTHVSA